MCHGSQNLGLDLFQQMLFLYHGITVVVTVVVTSIQLNMESQLAIQYKISRELALLLITITPLWPTQAYYKTRNTGTRNDRTRNTCRKTEQRRNTRTGNNGTRNISGRAETPRTTAEYQNNGGILDNGTPQKLEPEDKHGIFLSSGIRVRIPQELDVLAFWSWNLDVVVFQSWNLDVVAFCPLKKRLGITMSWLICLHFSMSWCFSP